MIEVNDIVPMVSCLVLVHMIEVNDIVPMVTCLVLVHLIESISVDR